MITAYICSPYRADNKKTLKRNKEYAKQLTRIALDNGFAPVTPHLYITRVTNEDSIDDRRSGMAAGMGLLKRCDVVVVGDRYGLSEGMVAEIQAARCYGKKLVYFEHCSSADNFISAVHEAIYSGRNSRGTSIL